MRSTLEGIFREAVSRCHGATLVKQARDHVPDGQLRVLGVGKAAVAMAAGLKDLAGDRIVDGQLTTKAGDGGAVPGLESAEASHPVPDERSEAAGRRALAYAQALLPHEVLVCLLSGGASALWAVPAEGLRLEDKRKTTQALLRSGADIRALNTVRRHLSAIKGGRLAQACQAERIVVLILSDVLGDDLDVVGSGPCLPDPSTLVEAHAIAAATEGVPTKVIDFLARDATETPKRLRTGITAHLVGNHETLRSAAVANARERGFQFKLVPPFAGEVSQCAAFWMGLPMTPRGILYIGGGEPTVVVRGGGRGGRSLHLALLMARAIRGTERVFLAAGSDGSDGPTDAAGAVVDGASWDRAVRLGLDPDAALKSFDSYSIHERLGGLVETGPTGTNLCDLHLFG